MATDVQPFVYPYPSPTIAITLVSIGSSVINTLIQRSLNSYVVDGICISNAFHFYSILTLFGIQWNAGTIDKKMKTKANDKINYINFILHFSHELWLGLWASQRSGAVSTSTKPLRWTIVQQSIWIWKFIWFEANNFENTII